MPFLSEATVRYAMLDIVKHPPAEFKDVVEAHFRWERGNMERDTAVGWSLPTRGETRWGGCGVGANATAKVELGGQVEPSVPALFSRVWLLTCLLTVTSPSSPPTCCSQDRPRT